MDPTRRPFTRRSLLVNSTAFSGMILTPRLLRGAGPPDDATKPDHGFKIGVPDWSVGKLADPAAFDIARQLGLDGVQISLGTAANDMHLRKVEVQQRYRETARRTGLAIASLAIGEMNSIPYKSDDRAERWVWDSVDVAGAMGVQVILLAFFNKGDLRNDPEGVKEVIRRLRHVAPKAEKQGVILGIESWLSAEDHMRIIDGVGSSAVRVYYDLGNSHLRGYDIYREIRWLGREHICEFHAKDYKFIFGQGKVDFVRVRRAMDDIGYRGWIQIEGAQPLGMMESYRKDAVYLRKVFPPKL